MIQRATLFTIALLWGIGALSPALLAADVTGGVRVEESLQNSEGPLRAQIERLFQALNKRDLETIKSQISPQRIYVEVSDKMGAYLTNSQTLAVMESFLRSHTALSAKFEFDSSDGGNGSASGSLTARKDGKTLTYRLNFGFTRNQRGAWLLTRISMR